MIIFTFKSYYVRQNYVVFLKTCEDCKIRVKIVSSFKFSRYPNVTKLQNINIYFNFYHDTCICKVIRYCAIPMKFLTILLFKVLTK